MNALVPRTGARTARREAFGRAELLALAYLLVAVTAIGWSASTLRREAFRTVDTWVQQIAAIYTPM